MASNSFGGYRLQYYYIEGTTFDELQAQIKTQSPNGAFGTASSTKKLSERSHVTKNGCEHAYLKFTQDIVIHMPKWTNRRKAPVCLQHRFERAWTSVMQHEIKHREIHRQLDGIVIRELEKIGPMRTCALLKQERERVYQALLAENQRRHDLFHRTGPVTYFDDCAAG